MKMTPAEKLFVNRPGHGARVARRAEKLLERCAVQTGQRYLEVGCGVGAAAQRIAETRNLDVVGIDIDPDQIRTAESGPALPNLRFLTMDATRLQFRRALPRRCHLQDHAPCRRPPACLPRNDPGASRWRLPDFHRLRTSSVVSRCRLSLGTWPRFAGCSSRPHPGPSFSELGYRGSDLAKGLRQSTISASRRALIAELLSALQTQGYARSSDISTTCFSRGLGPTRRSIAGWRRPTVGSFPKSPPTNRLFSSGVPARFLYSVFLVS